VFEAAVLSELRELTPADVLGTDAPADDVAVLRDDLAYVRAKKGELEAELLKGDLAALSNALRELETRERELTTKLDKAEMNAAMPIDQTWKEAGTLIEMLANAADPVDVRLKLRAALRRLVSEVWLLVVPRGRDRLAEVQLHFSGRDGNPGGFRSIFIAARGPRGNQIKRTAGRFSARSIRHPGNLSFLKEDLRDATDAENVRRFMERYPEDMLDELLRDGQEF
jgi:hypothetical protein